MGRVTYPAPTTKQKNKLSLNPFDRKVSFKILKNGKMQLKVTLSFKK